MQTPPMRSGRRSIVSGQAGKEHSSDKHGRYDRHRVGFKQVGGHAGAVAYVVTHVVGDHGRVPGIVFRDTSLDLTNHVGANISALRKDTTAKTGKNGNQRRAEAQRDKRFEDVSQTDRIAGIVNSAQNHIISGDTQQPEPHNQHPGHRTGLEGDRQGRLQTAGPGSISRPHIGAHRNMHSDVPSCPDRIAPRKTPSPDISPAKYRG